MDPVSRFLGDFFTRNEPKPNLSDAERQLIIAAIGENPANRWDGSANAERMAEILNDDPTVLDNIATRLLNTIIGIRGCGPAIKFLLDHDVPFSMVQDEYNQMHEGGWAGAVDSLQALFQSGVVDATCVSVEKPHLGWPGNISLMYWAAYQGSVDMTKLLLKYGAGIHHELQMTSNGERGATSLQETAAPPKQGSREEHLAVAKLLIADGAYYDMGAACGMNDVKRVNALLNEDAANASNPLSFDMTPLHWAARAGAEEVTRILLSCDVDVDARNQSHRTPLQLAAEMNESTVIELIAEAGADLNTQDKKGRTPLHRATYEGQVAAAEALLAQGADPMVTNKSGKTAFQIARKDAKFFKKQAT